MGRLVVALHQGQLRGINRDRGLADARRRNRQQQFVHIRRVADASDELAHHPEATAVRHAAGVRGEVPGDQPQQRRLARAVRADERGRDAVADPERDVVKQHPAVRQGVTDMSDLDMAHGSQSPEPYCVGANHFLSRRRNALVYALTFRPLRPLRDGLGTPSASARKWPV